MAKAARNSNIELLRILSICAIITMHFSAQSGTIICTPSINDFLLVFASSGGRIAVNVFLLIGIWYMTDAKFSASRILKLYGQLYLFSSLFTVIALLMDYKAVSLKSVVFGFLPFTGRALWFASSYLCLLLFKPFLDIILQWEKKRLITFTVLFLAFMSGLSTALVVQDGFLIDTVWFAAVYLAIGVFKKYPPQMKWKGLYSLIIFWGGVIALSIVKYLVAINGLDGIFYKVASRVGEIYGSDIKSLPNIFLACMIFHFFITLKPRESKVINGLAKGTFSVYIIHQVPAFYPLLWSAFFNAERWLPEHQVWYVAVVVVTVFAVCSIIDIPRRKWLEPVFSKSKLFQTLASHIEKIYL